MNEQEAIDALRAELVTLEEQIAREAELLERERALTAEIGASEEEKERTALFAERDRLRARVTELEAAITVARQRPAADTGGCSTAAFVIAGVVSLGIAVFVFAGGSREARPWIFGIGLAVFVFAVALAGVFGSKRRP